MPPINTQSLSPPVIGKIGPYTVFVTPPSTPNQSTAKIVPPPVQMEKPDGHGSVSVVGFFKNAVTKVQTAHSSLDDHLARWFGLNQSKYQWALNDYYESKGMDSSEVRCEDSRFEYIYTLINYMWSRTKASNMSKEFFAQHPLI